MSRHGESINNTLGIIGGDCHITEKGMRYSKFLGNYFKNVKISVWTSNLLRTKETAASITSCPKEWSNLNEIYSGDFEGLVLDNIKVNYPELYYTRNNDKLNNSYPNGESYTDVYNRVVHVLTHITDSDTILIIAHQAVCRVLYSCFTKKPLSECIDMKIDLHTLYEFKDQECISILFSL
jgi:broad specificity phosphatase PhoE